jgi:transcriptional regulator with XRE-family HTH domain
VKVGREIRRRRRGLGWTLEDLSDKSGLSAHYLSNLENDKRDPSLSTIAAVSRALGTTPADLLGTVKGIVPAGIEAAKLFQSLPAESQEVVLQLMRQLLRRR